MNNVTFAEMPKSQSFFENGIKEMLREDTFDKSMAWKVKNNSDSIHNRKPKAIAITLKMW